MHAKSCSAVPLHSPDFYAGDPYPAYRELRATRSLPGSCAIVGIGQTEFSKESGLSRVHHGGGAAAGTVVHAAMAVATRAADVVVCWRAFNERSGFRFGGSGRTSAETPLFMAHYAPFGLLTPAAWVAMHAQRHMSTYGVTNEDFGRVGHRGAHQRPDSRAG